MLLSSVVGHVADLIGHVQDCCYQLECHAYEQVK